MIQVSGLLVLKGVRALLRTARKVFPSGAAIQRKEVRATFNCSGRSLIPRPGYPGLHVADEQAYEQCAVGGAHILDRLWLRVCLPVLSSFFEATTMTATCVSAAQQLRPCESQRRAPRLLSHITPEPRLHALLQETRNMLSIESAQKNTL